MSRYTQQEHERIMDLVALGMTPDEAAELYRKMCEQDAWAMQNWPTKAVLEHAQRIRAADSIRPEHLWGKL